MATRFAAAAMSIVGIVLNALALSGSSSDLDKAMNSLFLASVGLDLVAAAAGWAISLAWYEVHWSLGLYSIIG